MRVGISQQEDDGREVKYRVQGEWLRFAVMIGCNHSRRGRPVAGLQRGHQDWGPYTLFKYNPASVSFMERRKYPGGPGRWIRMGIEEDKVFNSLSQVGGS